MSSANTVIYALDNAHLRRRKDLGGYSVLLNKRIYDRIEINGDQLNHESIERLVKKLVKIAVTSTVICLCSYMHSIDVYSSAYMLSPYAVSSAGLSSPAASSSFLTDSAENSGAELRSWKCTHMRS